MHLHTGNVCCVVVSIDQLLVSQANNQINIIQTHILLYIFMFITSLPGVQCMEDYHWTKKPRLCLRYTYSVPPEKYTQEKSLLLWIHLFLTLTQVSTLQQYKN